MSANTLFATWAASRRELVHCSALARSLRQFGGMFADSPVWLFSPSSLAADDTTLRDFDRHVALGPVGEAFQGIPFASKVFAAAAAEEAGEGAADILAWLDEDTVIVGEPSDFLLRSSCDFAFRPVMHNRTGSLASEPPADDWQALYDCLQIDQERLFPVVTPVDRQTIRAYFNAGILIVRPELGLLRTWLSDFKKAVRDPNLSALRKDRQDLSIFLHQMALVGAPFETTTPQRMLQLSDAYNYPLFFQANFDSPRSFDDLHGVVTLRHDVYFRDPDPDWPNLLKGPASCIDWLAANLET